jgi:hypothetical protein
MHAQRARKERDLLCYSATSLFMKKFMFLGAFALAAASVAEQSPVADQSPQVQALMKEVQAQQIQLADNQAKIDAKLADLAEAIRVAKIYASRGGR